MKASNAAPMMRSDRVSSAAGRRRPVDRFFVFGNESSCVGTGSYLNGYDVVPQQERGRGAMIANQRKTQRVAGLRRRDVLALAGAAAGELLAGPAVAQSPPSAAPTPKTQAKATVVLDRPVKGVLTIGIDRSEAQNRIDIETFSALG